METPRSVVPGTQLYSVPLPPISGPEQSYALLIIAGKDERPSVNVEETTV